MSEDKNDTSFADEIIAKARSKSDVHRPGKFTIDKDAANEKLQKYQLQNNWLFPLEFVRAAVQRDAERIDISVKRNLFEIIFDGHCYMQKDFEMLDEILFGGGNDPNTTALRQLAYCINIAKAVSEDSIEVVSGDGNSTFKMISRLYEKDVVEKIETQVTGTKVVFYCNSSSALIENADVIKERCKYSSTQITFNGERISHGMVLNEATDSIPVPGYKNSVCGICPDYRENQLHLVKNAVWINSQTIGRNVSSKEKPIQGCKIVLEDNNLTLDLSNNKVVENEAFNAAKRAAKETSVNVFNLLDCNTEHGALFDKGGSRLFYGANRSKQGKDTSLVELSFKDTKQKEENFFSYVVRMLKNRFSKNQSPPSLSHLDPGFNKKALKRIESKECISLSNLKRLINRKRNPNTTIRVRGVVTHIRERAGRDKAVIRDSWIDKGDHMARVTVSKSFLLKINEKNRSFSVKVKAGPSLTIFGQYAQGAAPPSLTSTMNNLPNWFSEQSNNQISFWDLVTAGMGIKIEENDEVIISATKWKKTKHAGKRTLTLLGTEGKPLTIALVKKN
ncbi:MAG: hypothetical protein GY854_14865 [Deltaproteobacteria bacterium]|nr:hypothetical protein [Deltaproteobacteria bacterium]